MNQNNNPIENTQNTQPQNIQAPSSTTQPVTPQTATTPLPSTSVSQVPTKEQTNNTNSTQVTPTNNTEPEKKGGCFKRFFAFIFLIGLIGLVIFLPDVTKFIKTKTRERNTPADANVVKNGTLTCKMEKETDETSVAYELNYSFEDKTLVTSNYEIKYESLNTNFLEEKNLECENIKTISEGISGITTTCTYKNGILKLNEEYINKDLEDVNLTAYTEAGGTYPEFKYGDDVYDIQNTLIKEGYDCEVKSN